MTQEKVKSNIGYVVLSKVARPKVGGYTLYNGCVYHVVASEGKGITDFSITLESNGRQERFNAKQPEAGQLRMILYPTGHINC